MPPHLRVKKLRHGARYPAQIEAHAIFWDREVQYFRNHGVHIHYLDRSCQILFRPSGKRSKRKSGICSPASLIRRSMWTCRRSRRRNRGPRMLPAVYAQASRFLATTDDGVCCARPAVGVAFVGGAICMIAGLAQTLSLVVSSSTKAGKHG